MQKKSYFCIFWEYKEIIKNDMMFVMMPRKKNTVMDAKKSIVCEKIRF